MKTIKFFIIFFSMILPLAGCDDSSDNKAELIPPDLSASGKTDDTSDKVNILGRISFGGEVFGSFIQDNQLDGYFFSAREGAVITIDNSNLGTSRNLDSTLFLYGPKKEDGTYGETPLTFDDDGGWGTHARISGFTIPKSGEYLIIMGTYLNIDRGDYRLTLECEGDSCIIPCDENCPSDDPCSGFECSQTDGCITTEIPDSCSDGKNIIITQNSDVTSENSGTATFTVGLNAKPDENVLIWVESSDLSEAVVYPQKLYFCKEGYTETSNGCTPIEDETIADDASWKQTIEVTVTGVKDMIEDGNTAYHVHFTIVTDDPDYAGLSLSDLSFTNMDVNTDTDYSFTDGLYDDDLLTALNAVISNHTAYGYLGQNSARTLMFASVDLRDDFVESIYTGEKIFRPMDSVKAYQAGFNTEHSWPQAQFLKAEPMKSDLHHIFPTDMTSNSTRGNYDYGMTSDSDSAKSFLGYSVSSGEMIFQVRPEKRGDIARAHFYMVARYKFDLIEGNRFDDNDNPDDGCINDTEEAVLRAWNAEDPVDDEERERNNRIEALQGNRNPFIDHPELIDRISDF